MPPPGDDRDQPRRAPPAGGLNKIMNILANAARRVKPLSAPFWSESFRHTACSFFREIACFSARSFEPSSLFSIQFLHRALPTFLFFMPYSANSQIRIT